MLDKNPPDLSLSFLPVDVTGKTSECGRGLEFAPRSLSFSETVLLFLLEIVALSALIGDLFGPPSVPVTVIDGWDGKTALLGVPGPADDPLDTLRKLLLFPSSLEDVRLRNMASRAKGACGGVK